jgi:hypothetical protein
LRPSALLDLTNSLSLLRSPQRYWDTKSNRQNQSFNPTTVYFHWNDRQGLDQDIDICLEQEVDIKEVKTWANKEGFESKFQKFLDQLRKQQAKIKI